MSKQSIAIIGTGIAGLGCAHFLDRHFDITLFEKASYPGGHVNTVEVQENGASLPIDTGFMVFNLDTYPNFSRLLDDLQVPYVPTDMSFSVQHGPSSLEWSGTGFRRLFARKRNLADYKFWQFLLSIDQFNRHARKELIEGSSKSLSVQDFVLSKGISKSMLDYYLLPMMSSLWSCRTQDMLNFPVSLLLRFMHSHGLLSIYDKLSWYTVVGGARQYVSKLIEPFVNRIRLNSAVSKIYPVDGGVELVLENGQKLIFDRCILACHADQSRRILSEHFREERRLLSAFPYQKNIATLHCDSSVMPSSRGNWASWNYRIERGVDGAMYSTTHYWMNSLQKVSNRKNYFVTIDSANQLSADSIVKQIEYEHPLFSLQSLRAQESLAKFSAADSRGPVHLCGSYFRYGFHEDAFSSAIMLCESLLGRPVWN